MEICAWFFFGTVKCQDPLAVRRSYGAKQGIVDPPRIEVELNGGEFFINVLIGCWRSFRIRLKPIRKSLGRDIAKDQRAHILSLNNGSASAGGRCQTE